MVHIYYLYYLYLVIIPIYIFFFFEIYIGEPRFIVKRYKPFVRVNQKLKVDGI